MGVVHDHAFVVCHRPSDLYAARAGRTSRCGSRSGANSRVPAQVREARIHQRARGCQAGFHASRGPRVKALRLERAKSRSSWFGVVLLMRALYRRTAGRATVARGGGGVLARGPLNLRGSLIARMALGALSSRSPRGSGSVALGGRGMGA